MPTIIKKCPICEQEFEEKRIILYEKNKKEVEEAKLIDLVPKVQDLIAQISEKPIPIEKITVITADREEQLQQTINPGMSLEVTIVPGLEPK